MQKEKNKQTATGFLAAILIGIIVGGVIAYPINQSANKKLAAAQSISLEQLEILTQEIKWFNIAETGLMKDTEDFGDRVIPVLDRLYYEAKREPDKTLLFLNTSCQGRAAIAIVTAYRSEVYEPYEIWSKARTLNPDQQ